MKSLKRTGAVLAIATAISSCTNVGDFKEPVSELSTALNSSAAVLNKIDEDQTKLRNQLWRDDLMASPARAILIAPDNQCSISGTGDNAVKDCALQIIHKGKQTGKPFPARSVIVNSRKGLTYLKTYVAGLKSIVDADTAAKIITETNKTFANLGRLEDTIAEARGEEKGSGKIAAYTASLSALTKWLAENYINHLKYKSLAEATARAHPAITGLEELMTGIGNAAAKLELADAATAFLAAQTAYDDAAEANTLNNQKINAYLKAAGEFDQALKASAAEPLKAFRVAHEKMKKHLNGEGDISLAEVFAAIKDLKDRADEFKVIVDGFKAVKSE